MTYQYGQLKIEIIESQPDPYDAPVYFWKVLGQDGETLDDNTKSTGEPSQEFAKHYAEQAADFMETDEVLE